MATSTQTLISYYANLLILQYINQPNAYAHVEALVTPAVMDQLPTTVQGGFTFGTAVGVQLDILGKYAGVTRYGNGHAGPIILDDGDFTTLIQLAILTNSADSSLATIQYLLNTYFPEEILVFDYGGMRMSYYLNSSVGSQALAELFISEGLLPKPMGVQLGSTIYAADITHFFGMRTYGAPAHNVSPLNSYTSYSSSTPFLTYTDALT